MSDHRERTVRVLALCLLAIAALLVVLLLVLGSWLHGDRADARAAPPTPTSMR